VKLAIRVCIMKGKGKCSDTNSKPFGNGNWFGNFGNISKRQQSARRWMVNPTALDDSNTSPLALAATGGRVVLDFETSSVRPTTIEENSEDFGIFVDESSFGSRSGPRFLPDDHYECLFRQSGSVEAQGS
ncbi:hypothetical protein Tco_0280131, partial [Tanacetum coccineum]